MIGFRSYATNEKKGSPSYKRAIGILVFPALLFYILVSVGCLRLVPGIYIESISTTIDGANIEVRLGYFGMCLSSNATNAPSQKCAPSWDSYSSLTNYLPDTMDSKSSTARTVESLLMFASNMQHRIFVGSPAFFPGAGLFFFFSVLMLAPLELLAGPRAKWNPKPSVVLFCSRLTITLFWLPAAWAFSSALSTIEATMAQQEVIKFTVSDNGSSQIGVIVKMGIALQCLQWSAFVLTTFFAMGMTSLKLKQAKELRGLARIPNAHMMQQPNPSLGYVAPAAPWQWQTTAPMVQQPAMAMQPPPVLMPQAMPMVTSYGTAMSADSGSGRNSLIHYPSTESFRPPSLQFPQHQVPCQHHPGSAHGSLNVPPASDSYWDPTRGNGGPPAQPPRQASQHSGPPPPSYSMVPPLGEAPAPPIVQMPLPVNGVAVTNTRSIQGQGNAAVVRDPSPGPRGVPSGTTTAAASVATSAVQPAPPPPPPPPPAAQVVPVVEPLVMPTLPALPARRDVSSPPPPPRRAPSRVHAQPGQPSTNPFTGLDSSMASGRVAPNDMLSAADYSVPEDDMNTTSNDRIRTGLPSTQHEELHAWTPPSPRPSSAARNNINNVNVSPERREARDAPSTSAPVPALLSASHPHPLRAATQSPWQDVSGPTRSPRSTRAAETETGMGTGAGFRAGYTSYMPSVNERGAHGREEAGHDDGDGADEVAGYRLGYGDGR